MWLSVHGERRTSCSKEARSFIDSLDISQPACVQLPERPGTQALKIAHSVDPKVKTCPQPATAGHFRQETTCFLWCPYRQSGGSSVRTYPERRHDAWLHGKLYQSRDILRQFAGKRNPTGNTDRLEWRPYRTELWISKQLIWKQNSGLIYSWAKVRLFLPMPVLYVLSDILYVLIYRVIRYRIRVIRRNMEASFPEKVQNRTSQAGESLLSSFSDYIVEDDQTGAHIAGGSVTPRPHQEPRSGHQVTGRRTKYGYDADGTLWQTGNGSVPPAWYTHGIQTLANIPPLNNKAVDRLFIFYLRTRFGSYGMKKNDTVRDMMTLKSENSKNIVIFIADQTPSKGKPALLDYLPEPGPLCWTVRNVSPVNWFAGHLPGCTESETRLLYSKWSDRPCQTDCRERDYRIIRPHDGKDDPCVTRLTGSGLTNVGNTREDSWQMTIILNEK